MLLAATLLIATPPQPLPDVDPLLPRIAEARAFARGAGDRIWPGYGAAPFGILVIGAGRETLLCQPAPEGFEDEGREPVTGCARAGRARGDLPDNLLAALPIFDLPATIVMGTPATTGRAEPDWARTILHEHFHQWQYALPGYFERVGALGLADGGDGMWMLNFPFPYQDEAVGAAYAAASNALADALDARGRDGFAAALDAYRAARARFADAAGARNWRYLEFQLWQEGVARWVEVTLGKAYPDPAVRAAATAFENRSLAALRSPDLARQRRELVYPYGAGEAMLIEACWPGWRAAYPEAMALGPLLEAAARHCAAPREEPGPQSDRPTPDGGEGRHSGAGASD